MSADEQCGGIVVGFDYGDVGMGGNPIGMLPPFTSQPNFDDSHVQNAVDISVSSLRASSTRRLVSPKIVTPNKSIMSTNKSITPPVMQIDHNNESLAEPSALLSSTLPLRTSFSSSFQPLRNQKEISIHSYIESSSKLSKEISIHSNIESSSILPSNATNTINMIGMSYEMRSSSSRIMQGAMSPVQHNPQKRKSTELKNHDHLPKSCAPYCHTFSSKNGLSSLRTQAAAGAYERFTSSMMLSRGNIRNRRRNRNRKRRKQHERLHPIQDTLQMKNIGEKFTLEFLRDNYVVFDGGCDEAVEQPNCADIKWYCSRISSGALVICNPPRSDVGLVYVGEATEHPTFILLPRTDALSINADGKEVCNAMAKISRTQNNLMRGKSKSVFSQNKYCCVGSKPRRNEKGVEPGHFKNNGHNIHEWDCIVKAVKQCERAFCSYASTEAIGRIREANIVVPWERIKFSEASSYSNPFIFNGLAFGVNVFLRAHIDHDFTYSVTQVHVNDIVYSINDDVVCYFCFPRLGIAIPMKPGDFLMFNALEYHCVSSRCIKDMEVYCVSSYLKTSVVGGNDNSKQLSSEEKLCIEAFANAERSRKKVRKR